ncbi:MAG TPA: hypothetical protein VIU15_43080 [Streptomyces sp.]
MKHEQPDPHGLYGELPPGDEEYVRAAFGRAFGPLPTVQSWQQNLAEAVTATDIADIAYEPPTDDILHASHATAPPWTAATGPETESGDTAATTADDAHPDDNGAHEVGLWWEHHPAPPDTDDRTPNHDQRIEPGGHHTEDGYSAHPFDHDPSS